MYFPLYALAALVVYIAILYTSNRIRSWWKRRARIKQIKWQREQLRVGRSYMQKDLEALISDRQALARDQQTLEKDKDALRWG